MKQVACGKRSKKISQRKHAKSRFKERLGVDLTTEQLDKIVNTIQNNQATFIRKQSNRISIWGMEYNKIPIHVVYDKRTRNIVTLLFPDKENLCPPTE